MIEATRSPDDIWTEDKLGSRSSADYLTRYLKTRYKAKPTEPGFVIAVNAAWGFGKTFMLKRWKDELSSKRHPVVYFDAWKNDFTPEPLVAFISEIDDGLESFFKEIPSAEAAFTEVMSKAKQVIMPMLKAAGYAVAKHALGIGADLVNDLIVDATGSEKAASPKPIELGASATDVAKSMEEAVTASLKEHKTTKQAISGFKIKLSQLITVLSEAENVNLPLFIFVDELDRCRPNYAIELLEGIKHLFGVPGIFFVVATNLKQLGESTKAIYGNEFDGHLYLKRFFDLEYSLPEPDGLKFAAVLFEEITQPEIGKFITGLEILNFPDRSALPFIFHKNARLFDCTLRDQLQAMRIIEAALITLDQQQIHIHFLIFLAMLYQKSPSTYERVVNAKNFTDITGFQLLKSLNHGDGYKTSNHHRNSVQESEFIHTSTEKVAYFYLRSAWKKLRDLYIEKVNNLDFPANLLLSFTSQENPCNSNSYPSIGNYIDIVRHAGGFGRSTS
ncbi:hypothetical protein ACFDR9_000288 [Janthinobacterium sp. CG_23.3]|uniref:KAP family P-loop NTPase fold protein n=1 Tax=Janthinobacterium sp. CG_23.3 TaxID=3349634 RepID=UPI0038D50847